MTTNTTNSQAASIMTAEFCDLLFAYHEAVPGGHAQAAIVAHIDAKLAQAYKKGQQDTAGPVLNSVFERAEKAEARLAEIQRGVEEMPRFAHTYGRQEEFKLHPTGSYIRREDVLALLAPQGQASACEHNIVSAVNQIVKSGMLCTKCGKLFHDDGTPI